MNYSKIASYSFSLSFKLSFKKNRCSSPNPAEALEIFPKAIRNGTIFRFPAKNDQMTTRKYHIYIYHFVAYFMLILNIYIYMSYQLRLVIQEIIRISFSECELGKVRGKNLKVPLFAERKFCFKPSFFSKQTVWKRSNIFGISTL